MDKPKIAVFGTGTSAGIEDEKLKESAKTIGMELARHGCILVTGGCAGLPYIANMAAHSAGAETIAFSPATGIRQHKNMPYPAEGFTKLVFVPENYEHKDNIKVCLKYRNVSSVAFSDAAIFIAGRIGTVNEFTNAYDIGKVIGILEGSGGTMQYIKQIIDTAKKETGAEVIFEKNPAKLVEKVVEAARNKNDK